MSANAGNSAASFASGEHRQPIAVAGHAAG